jgi:hypothetical protein
MMMDVFIRDVTELSSEHQAVYAPLAQLVTRDGAKPEFPSRFYEIASREHALATRLSANFVLAEFLHVDLHEHPIASAYPRYIPCAASLLAAHLQVLRDELGTYIHIAANGGYRSPSHALSTHASTHSWATAANIYRIGDDYLDTEEKIRKYAEIVRRVLPHVTIREYGHGVAEANDHLHLDLGYTDFNPMRKVGEA